MIKISLFSLLSFFSLTHCSMDKVELSLSLGMPLQQPIHDFLKAGGNPNSVVKNIKYKHKPLLNVCIQVQDPESVKLLCQYGADVNIAPCKYYKTPIMTALTHHDKINHDIVTTLLQARAQADCPDNDSDINGYPTYALHYAIGLPYFSTFNPKLTFLFLEHGANPNRPFPCTKGKNYPLHQAVRLKHFEVIKALLAKDAQTDYRDQENRTPLELAQYLGCSQEIISLLSQYTTATPKTNAGNQKKSSCVIQ
jgi:ankyrin repeat protein